MENELDSQNTSYAILDFQNQPMAWLWLAIIIAAITFGSMIRLENISQRGLEYDEIWTFVYYAGHPDAGVIFSDLSTPNNHPLHSLAVRWSVNLPGEQPFTIRLPAFIAGVLSIIAGGGIAQLLFRNWSATVYSTAFFSLNGFLIHYSRTARGYTMQILTVVLFLLLIVYYEQRGHNYPSSTRRLLCMSTAIMAVFAILTLPTSVLYLAPIILLHLGYSVFGKRKNENQTNKRTEIIYQRLLRRMDMLIAYSAVALFCLFWYTLNFQQFRQAQDFGIVTTDLRTWFVFVRETLFSLNSWPYLALPLAAFIFPQSRKQALLFLFLILFPLLSATVFRAGPPRAYIPLQIFIGLAGSLAITGCNEYLHRVISAKDNLRHHVRHLLRLPSAVMLTFVLMLFSQARKETAEHTPVDWKEAVHQLTGSFDYNTYLAYPAAAGYPVRYNNFPNVIVDNFQRAIELGHYWLQIETPGIVSGTDAEGRTRNIEVKGYTGKNQLSLFGLKCDLYTVRETGQTDNHQNVIVVIGPLPQSQAEQILSSFLRQENNTWIRINPWLVDPVAEIGTADQPLVMEVLFTRQLDWSYNQLREITEKTADSIRFFELTPPPSDMAPDQGGKPRDSRPGR